MLPAPRRMRRSADFSTAVRSGFRAGRPTLVVHLAAPAHPTDRSHPSDPATVGFVVSRAVGGAVVRNRVKRRLRHLASGRLDRVPPGSRLVVRALPPSATASGAELAADLDDAVRRAAGRLRAVGRRS